MSQLSLFTDGPVLGPDFPLPLDQPFTTRAAQAAGVTRRTLATLVDDGYIRRLLRGVFVASHVPDSLLLRAHALRLVVPTDVVVVDWTAVWLFTGVLPFGHHLSTPPVALFRPSGHGRLRNSLSVSGERHFEPEDTMIVDGLVVTTPLRTAWDIGRLSHRDIAIGGLDALSRINAFTHDELVDGIERFRRQRGVVQLRYLGPLADGRAESAGESVLRLRWCDMPSLPRPVPQVPIFDARGDVVYRLDLGVEELRFAAEYDGEEFHSQREDVEHDRGRRAWIEAHRQWIIEPVRKANVFGVTRDVERILHEGIRRARRELGTRRFPAA